MAMIVFDMDKGENMRIEYAYREDLHSLNSGLLHVQILHMSFISPTLF